ncbi:MAG: citrate synthase, partial [Planifilum fulgidum]
MTVAKGLEGVVAVTSEVSSIIDGVLTYRGINIDELAEKASFEEVILLLWNGRLPKKEELEELQRDLDENASIPDEVLNALK